MPSASFGWSRVRSFVQALGAMKTALQKSSVLQADGLKPKDGRPAGHGSYLDVLRKGVKTAPALRAFAASRNAKNAQAEALQLMQTGQVVTEVTSKEELKAVEFYLQGDSTLCTQEAIEARQALRYHRKVLESLQALWAAAQASLQSGGDPSASELHQEGHALMLRRVYRVMIKRFDANECERSIADDWVRDCKGAQALSRKRFCDAFFELADTVYDPALLKAGCP